MPSNFKQCHASNGLNEWCVSLAETIKEYSDVKDIQLICTDVCRNGQVMPECQEISNTNITETEKHNDIVTNI